MGNVKPFLTKMLDPSSSEMGLSGCSCPSLGQQRESAVGKAILVGQRHWLEVLGCGSPEFQPLADTLQAALTP